MAPLANRDQHEAALLAAMIAIHNQAMKDIESQLGDPPTADQVPASFWEALQKKYQDAAKPLLVALYLDAVAQLVGEIGEPVDLTAEAEAWAGSYSGQFAASLVGNRNQSLADFIAKGLTKAEILQRLAALFSEANAQSIAITEATSAISAGSQGYADAYKLLTTVALSSTVRNDFEPCDECVDKQGKSPYIVGFPPYHPRCRCYEDWSVRK